MREGRPLANRTPVTLKPGLLLLLLLLVPAWIHAGDASHDHPVPEKLGTVSFPNSCQPAVQARFVRAVALLHSFAYSAAESAFRRVAAQDQGCAVAHWGVAMTYFHQLWDPLIQPEGLLPGAVEIERAERIGTGSDRERRFIHALALVYQPAPASDTYPVRLSKYLGAMAELAAAYPDDVESQVFYALALLASGSPFDKTHEKQKQAAKILEPLFQQYPQHPGIAHYLVHACDNQEMAGQGLASARAYAKVAPAAPHALHMPSHIFTRLGLWDDSIASNQAARVAAHRQRDVGEELHALDYLVYADLQQGREREAGEVIEQLEAMRKLDLSDFKVAYASVAMPVRFAIERRRWNDAALIVPPNGAPPHVVAIAVWAGAMGLARSGHPAGARERVAKLRQLAEQVRGTGSEYGEYWARQVEIQALEVSAWSSEAEGKAEEARTLLGKAADDEDSLEKLPVTPGPIVPAREQLGDLLLKQNQPALALKEFRTALANAPGRRGALEGVSHASEALAHGSS